MIEIEDAYELETNDTKDTAEENIKLGLRVLVSYMLLGTFVVAAIPGESDLQPVNPPIPEVTPEHPPNTVVISDNLVLVEP